MTEDLAFALERSFLAQEFLTWLWFRCEVEGGDFRLPDSGEVSLLVEDALSLASWDDDGTRAFAQGAAISSDDRNRLQTESPRVLRQVGTLSAWATQFAPYDPLAHPTPQLDRVYLVRRLLDQRMQERCVKFLNPLGVRARYADRDIGTVFRCAPAEERYRG